MTKWPKRRKRYRWHFGDPDLLNPKLEWGLYIDSEKLTVLHPHLRRRKHHDLLWEIIGHEFLHAISGMSHARILKMERKVGQLLHDLAKCRKCD